MISNLKRTKLRRYLKALFYSNQVPQDAVCGIGDLWTNCNGEPLDIFDSETHQIFENVEASYQIGLRDAAVIFTFESVKYQFIKTKVDSASISLYIDIVVNASSGEKRQDMLDLIEERLIYRLLSHTSFIDATTAETLTSFMNWADRNDVNLETRDESDFKGIYTLRRMKLDFVTSECIKRPGCDDVPICFDFEDLTRLDEFC